jgi:hypothetical protein
MKLEECNEGDLYSSSGNASDLKLEYALQLNIETIFGARFAEAYGMNPR